MAGNKRRPDHRTQKQLEEDNGTANGNDERHSLGLSLSLAAFWQPPVSLLRSGQVANDLNAANELLRPVLLQHVAASL